MLASTASSARVAPAAMMRSSVVRLWSHGGGAMRSPMSCGSGFSRELFRPPERAGQKLAAEAAPARGSGGFAAGRGCDRERVPARGVVKDVGRQHQLVRAVARDEVGDAGA